MLFETISTLTPGGARTRPLPSGYASCQATPAPLLRSPHTLGKGRDNRLLFGLHNSSIFFKSIFPVIRASKITYISDNLSHKFDI